MLKTVAGKKVDDDEEEIRNKCIIDPTNSFKLNWDVFVTILLMYSCIATPVQIALWDELEGTPQVINWIVDSLFFLDIIIIFNSAFYDD